MSERLDRVYFHLSVKLSGNVTQELSNYNTAAGLFVEVVERIALGETAEHG